MSDDVNYQTAPAEAPEQSLEQAFNEKQALQPVEAGEEQKSSGEFDSKFAALSRKEKALREQENAIGERMAKLEEMIASMNQPKPEEEKPVELPLEYRLKKDPLNTLNELGLSYEQLTDLVLNDGKMPADMQIKLLKEEMDNKYSSELDKLRAELAEKEKAQEEVKYQETLTAFKNEIAGFVKSSEEHELIKANDAGDLVYDVIEQHHQETGRILDIKEAADLVESHLLEETKKLLNLGKVKSILGSDREPQVEDQRQAPVTLSNSQAARVPNQQSRSLSRDESIMEAAKTLRWTT